MFPDQSNKEEVLRACAEIGEEAARYLDKLQELEEAEVIIKPRPTADEVADKVMELWKSLQNQKPESLKKA